MAGRHLRGVDLLDAAHDKRPIGAGPAEEGHISAGRRDDISAADELADTALADPSLQRASEEWDDVPFRRLEPAARGVDPKDASPDARHAMVTRGPALVAAAERAAGHRAALGDQEDDRDSEGHETSAEMHEHDRRAPAWNGKWPEWGTAATTSSAVRPSIDHQAAFDHDRLMGNDDAIWAFVAQAEPERHREAGRSLAASR